MPSSSGHHHREPRARKVYGKGGGPAPVGKVRHDYQPQDGWAGCSCGMWTRTGSEFITKSQWRVHVAEMKRQTRERKPGKPRRPAKMSPQQLLNDFWKKKSGG
jgi:hypothetical protein